MESCEYEGIVQGGYLKRTGERDHGSQGALSRQMDGAFELRVSVFFLFSSNPLLSFYERLLEHKLKSWGVMCACCASEKENKGSNNRILD